MARGDAAGAFSIAENSVFKRYKSDCGVNTATWNTLSKMSRVVSAGYPKPPPAGDAAPRGSLQLSDRAGAARDI